MGRVRSLQVAGYRSVRDDILMTFPENTPVVLVGENNSGKSNIVRALDLVLGESWPGSHNPDDHEYFGRDKANGSIEIVAELAGVNHADRQGTDRVEKLNWKCSANGPARFSMTLWQRGESPYVSNDIRGQCACIYIAADRRLDYQLSYASKFTFLSKLMRKFHDRLMSDPTRAEDLRHKFDETKAIFLGVPEFAEFTSELQSQIAELSGSLQYGLDVDFSAYDPSNFFHALRVHASEGGEVRTIEELGSGQEQILALSFIQAYARAFHDAEGLILVIDEPEANLHPLAQDWLARKIRDLAGSGVQVVVTTHSPAFLDIVALPGLVLVRKNDGCTETVQMTPAELARFCQDHGAARATAENVLGFYAAAATEEILSGFFARKIVLVEGPTEAAALPVYLERVGFIPAKEGVAVIAVHGVGNLAKWWRLFSAYGIPTYVVFDNDARDDKAGAKRSDLLATQGISEDQHAAYLNTSDWVVEETFCIFGGDYEATMRRAFGPDYAALEDEARAVHGFGQDSKPLLARDVAQHLLLEHFPDGRKQLERLAGTLRGLASSSTHGDSKGPSNG
ncbi:MAG: hypothetical protein C0506_12050 [Anaerolinea sp.]|nr:hypothetical protein [Anaerolinea sp.]